MIGFEYARPGTVADAVRQMATSPGAKFIAGGTNLFDLMKVEVERPAKLIDISKLPLEGIEETPGGGLRIGALVRKTMAWIQEAHADMDHEERGILSDGFFSDSPTQDGECG